MNLKGRLKAEDIRRIFSKRKPGAEKDFRFFSVLVPLIKKEDGLYLLYEVRARHMETQPGDVCFPGGMIEGDESPCECALRETEEETGIKKENIEIINQLDTIYTHSRFLMYCYLGIMDESALEDVKLNRDEVEEIFFVHVDEIVSREPEIYVNEIIPKVAEGFPYEKIAGGKSYPWRKGKEQVPLYYVDGRTIWGLTGRITKAFADIVAAESEI